MKKGLKVAVAMSGGVDSSVAAALLKDEGYDVTGVSFVFGQDYCSASEWADSAARELGIPHRFVDLRNRFQETVVQPFIEEYARGRTPNPCVSCNRAMKFDALMNEADAIGATFIATGHYARTLKTACEKSEWCLLRKGKDKAKDQSYVLYRLTQPQICRAVFPLGGLLKAEVRQLAKKMNLEARDRPESQEICFVGPRGYREFLREQVPDIVSPGPILDLQGRVVGEHQGIAFYTIGQRKGLGALGRPSYVVAIDLERNALIVGEEKDLQARRLIAEDANWFLPVEEGVAFSALAKVRYKAPEERCTIYPRKGGHFEIVFEAPQRAATPGQSVVVYDGDIVLGGGVISKALAE